MSDNTVSNYGWDSEKPAYSTGYISPRIKETLKSLGVKRVADLGTGNGSLCAELAAEGYDVVGIEYDMQGVAIAKKTHPKLPFYNFGVQDNPELLLAQEKPFDAVVSTEVIEHLFSPHLLPQFARAILKPNGYLVITTPYHGYLKNLALAVLGKWDSHLTALWHGGHIKFWSRKTLTQLLQENGFAVVGFSGVGRMPYLWKSMVLVARKVP
jgi:2-polyprenyl-3-methyl-5-hydroxy-6-metoxy-1,4-benzoquinol methylase